MLTLIWLEPALEQLETILDHIAERNIAASERLQAAIEAFIAGLKDRKEYELLQFGLRPPAAPFAAAGCGTRSTQPRFNISID